MKTQNLILFFIVVMTFVIAPIAPFLPGPANELSHSISKFAQTIGYFGLFFMPFGLFWLIVEIRNKKDQKLNKWTNGYYPALLTVSPFILLCLIQIGVLIKEGVKEVPLAVVIVLFILVLIFYPIQKLRNKTAYNFNIAPVYIVLLPLAVLPTSKFAVEKAATYCRENVIKETEPLITALEKYKTAQGDYPEKLEDLVGTYIQTIPTFNIIALSIYHLNKTGIGMLQTWWLMSKMVIKS
jgi:hypothetical protein